MLEQRQQHIERMEAEDRAAHREELAHANALLSIFSVDCASR